MREHWADSVPDPGPPWWLGLGVACVLGALGWLVLGTILRWIGGAP